MRLPSVSLVSNIGGGRAGSSSPRADIPNLLEIEGEPLRVLIVEDDAMVAGVLQDIVQEAGGEVAGTISSGLASVGAAAAIRPDIAIMDVGLPGMDGIDAAAIIRTRYRLPVVFISGTEVSPEARHRLGDVGGVEFLLKPIRAEILREALLKAFASVSPTAG
jgi:CheY-like chemotaxis protein